MGRLLAAILFTPWAILAFAEPAWFPASDLPGSLAGRISVMALAVDPVVPGHVYAGVSRAVFVSVDAGTSFAALPPLPTTQAVRSLSVLRTAAGTPPRLLVGLENEGILVSANGGATYVRGLVDGAPLAFTIWSIEGAVDRDDVAFIRGTAMHYRTDDGGLTWRELATPASGDPGNLAVGTRGDVLFLGASNGIFRSPDGGVTWAMLAGGLPAPPYGAGSILAIDPAEPKRVVAILPSIGTYRSSDGGLSWQRTGAAPFDCCIGPLLASGDTLWTTINGRIVARSRDAGATWGGLPLPSTESWQALIRDRASGALYLGSNSAASTSSRGFYRSVDGGDGWRADSAGLPGTGVSNLSVDPGRALYAMGWGIGVHAMPGRQAAWRDVTPPNASFVTGGITTPLLVTGPGRLMISGRDFWRSEDGGANWTRSPIQAAANRIDLLVSRPATPAAVYGVAEVIEFAGYSAYVAALSPRRSLDAGATWVAIDAGLPKFTFDLAATGASRLVATTSAGVWTSEDDGISWMPRPEVAGSARAMRSRPGNADDLFILTDAGLYRSLDGGADFKRMSDLPDPNAKFVAPDGHPSEGVHLVTNTGAVLTSADGGRTWLPLGGDLGGRESSVVHDVVVSPWTASTLYAATGFGVYKFVARPGVDLVQEFHHAAFDHYFMTASESEAAALLTGQVEGWQSTGRRFAVTAPDLASPPNLPVCRFFSASFAPRSSHFYTPYPDECAQVKASGAWIYEGIAFALVLPEGSPGARQCPVGSQPFFRAYNNQANGAPNHRFSIDAGVLDQMIARGWTMEGEAATRVFACVPAQD